MPRPVRSPLALLAAPVAAPVAALIAALIGVSALIAPAPASAQEQRAYTASDPLLDDLLERAALKERQGATAEAVRLYLEVEKALDKRPSEGLGARPVTEVGPGRDRGVGLYLRDRIAALPPEGLAQYRLTIDPRARQALDQALAAGSPDAIEAVIARYPLSTVVGEALEQLAARATERGELGRALRAYRQLRARLQAPEATRRVALQELIVAAARHDRDAAQGALAAFVAAGGDPSARRAHAGREVTAQQLSEVRARGPGRAAPAPAGFDPGLLEQTTELQRPEVSEELARRAERPLTYQQAVLAPEGDRVFVADWKTVRALTSPRGTSARLPRWSDPAAPPDRSVEGWTFSLQDEESEPSRVEVASLRPALGAGRVYATLHRNRPAELRAPKEGEELPEVVRRKDWRVVALDRDSGRLVWDAGERADFEGIARDAEWVSPPLFFEGGVYVTVLERQNDLRASLVRLNAADGALRWRTFIASRSGSDFLGLAAPQSAPAVSPQGHVVVAPGVGVVAAVEPSQGDLEWVARYPAFPEASTPSVVDERRRFRAGEVLAERSPLVVAPVDGISVLALDAATGALRWSAPRGDAQVCAAGPRGEVLLLGGRLRVLDRSDGRVQVAGPPLGGVVAAAPAIATEELLAVTAEELLRIGLIDGVVRSRYRFERPRLEAGAPLLIGPDLLVTVGYDRLNLYASLERARTTIEQAGGPPWERDLRFGALYARRGELDRAVRHLVAATRSGADQTSKLRARHTGLGLVAEAALRRRAAGDPEGFLDLAGQALDFLGEAGAGARTPVARAERDLILIAMPLLRAYADALAEGERRAGWARAADAYQRLLSAPPGALVPLDSGTEVDARAYARDRVRALVARRGSEPYAAYERLAQDEYRLARASKSAAGLRRVVEAFPASAVAADARWDLAAYLEEHALRADAVRELERFLAEWPADPRVPEARARLVMLLQHTGRYVDAHAQLERLMGLDPQTQVAGAIGQPTRPLATWAAPIEQALQRQLTADAAARARATARLDPPLTRLFRGPTELSQDGAELLALRAPADSVAAGLFFLRRGGLIEVRRARDGELQRTVPGASGTFRLQPLLAGSLLVVPSTDRIEAYRLSGDAAAAADGQGAAEAGPAWRTTLPRGAGLVRIGPYPVHAVEATAERVYVLSGTNEVLALDAADGQVRWRFPLPLAASGLLARGDRVLAISERPPATVTALDAEGKVAWTYQPQQLPGVQPRLSNALWVGDDRLVAVHGGKRLVCLDAAQGTELWGSGHDASWLHEAQVSPDGSSVVTRHQAPTGPELRVFSAATGKELWRDSGDGVQRGGARLQPEGPRASLNSMFVGGDAVYTLRTVGGQTELWAQDLAFGKKSWAWRLPIGSRPMAVVETPTAVLVPRNGVISQRAALTVLGRGSGEVLESHDLSGRRLLGEGAAAVDGVLVVSTERGVFGFGARDEEVLAREVIELSEALAQRPKDPLIRTRLAARLAQAGRRAAALDVLQEGILAEGLGTRAFDRMFAALTAISETASEEAPPILPIRRLPRPPEIDGELGDWWRPWSSVDLAGPRYVLPIQQAAGDEPGRWSGDEDLSARLYMGYDDKYFYFALDVLDLNLRPYDSEAERWIGDCLLMAIDTRNDGGEVVLGDDVLLSLALTLPRKQDEEEEEEEQAGEEQKPDGRYFVRRKEDNSGAVYEAAVPWSLFGKNGAPVDPTTGPAKGFEFGFNVILTDDDGDRFDGSQPDEQGFRGALKALELTPSVLLHYEKNRLWQGYIPKRFAKITLE